MKTKIVCSALLCAIFWAACNGKKSTTASDYRTSAADSTTASLKNADASLNALKLVKTADMNFKVKNVEHVSESIIVLTEKYKGMIMHHSLQSSVNRSEELPLSEDSLIKVSSYNTNVDMVVKVPSDKIEEFMNQVGKMAVYINHRDMDIQDKTLDYLSAQMKLLNRSQLVDQQKKGKVRIVDPGQIIGLKDEFVDQQISNRRIDESVKYSTIGLNFYQNNTIAKEVIANDDPSNFRLPFFKRLINAFGNGWYIFNELLITLANLWVFILAGIAGWLLYRYIKQRRVGNIPV